MRKLTKFIFVTDRHTDIHTDILQWSYRTFPFGGPKTGRSPIGPDLTWARGLISFGPGADSPLINFESWKIVPTMDGHECKPNTHTWPPWILKHPIYQPFHLSSKFNSMLRVTHRALLPAELGPKWWRHHPSFWAITPEEMNQFRWGFQHLIGIHILHPYSKFKKIVGAVFEKINKVSVFGQIWA